MSAQDRPLSQSISATTTLLIRVALGFAAVWALVTGRWSAVFASLGTLAVSFVPQVLASKARFRLPLQFEVIIALFLYATLFLGEVGDYYERFWWWDIVLHTGSAFAFGFAGFLILYLLTLRQKFTAIPLLVAVFSFSFGLAIGTLWEIFEYAVDMIFGTNMQKSGLRDTMGDLVVDMIGAGVASYFGYAKMKFSRWDEPFDLLVRWFLEANSRFKPRSQGRRR